MNSNKTEVLLVEGRTDPEIEVSPVLVEVALILKQQVHTLRIPLDSSLLLEKQVEAMIMSTFQQLQSQRQSFLCKI